MQLYTYHPLDYDILTQAPDLSKSGWYNDECKGIKDNFRFAYDMLFKKIGRQDVLWCYGTPYLCSNKLNKAQCFSEERVWHLDVPDKHVITINSDIWDCAINVFPYIPDCIYDLHPDFDKVYAAINTLFANPTESYDKLIKPLKKADIFRDQFLIPSPIKKQWVVRTHIIKPEKSPKFG